MFVQGGCCYAQRYEGYAGQSTPISRTEGKGAWTNCMRTIHRSDLKTQPLVFATSQYGTGMHGYFRARQATGGSDSRASRSLERELTPTCFSQPNLELFDRVDCRREDTEDIGRGHGAAVGQPGCHVRRKPSRQCLNF